MVKKIIKINMSDFIEWIWNNHFDGYTGEVHFDAPEYDAVENIIKIGYEKYLKDEL